MFRLLFVTDTHLRANPPVCRLDDFQEAVFAKLAEVAQLALSRQVACVVHGGDLFDAPNRLSVALIGRVAELFRSFPCPVYVVPGNHDLIGYSLATLPNTLLGLCSSFGLVRLLLEPTPLDPEGRVIAHPVPAAAEILDSAYMVERRDGCCHLIVAHDAVVAAPLHPEMPHRVITPDLSNADAVLAGHYHPGWPRPFSSGSTLYVNPGSLARIDVGSGSRRDVCVALLEVTPAGITAEYLSLRSARPYEEVFKEHSLREISLATIGSSLQHSERPHVVDVFTLLEQADAPEDVKEVIRKTWAQLDQSVTPVSWPDEQIHLTELSVTNFQSHAATTLELVPGLNVIVGSSDSGKSALLRALYWLYYNKPRGAEFIRLGAKSATVTARYDDGTELTRSRSTSSAGSYLITRLDGEQVKLSGIGNQLPADVLAVHRTPSLNLAGEDLSLNIALQFEPPFILGYPNSVNLALLDLLTHNDAAFAAIRQLRSDEDLLKRRHAAAVSDLNSVEQTLQTLASIAALAPRVKRLYGDYAVTLEDARRLQAMTSLLERAQQLRERADKLGDLLDRPELQQRLSGLEMSFADAEALTLSPCLTGYAPLADRYQRELRAAKKLSASLNLEKLRAAADDYISTLEEMSICPVCGGDFTGCDLADQVRSDCAAALDEVARTIKEVSQMPELPIPEDDPVARLRQLRQDYESVRSNVVAMNSLLKERLRELELVEDECRQKFQMSLVELGAEVEKLHADLQSRIERLSSELNALKAEYETLRSELGVVL